MTETKGTDMTETQTVEARTETLERRIRNQLERYVQADQDRREKFLERYNANPAFAFQWAGSDVEFSVLGGIAKRVLDVADSENNEYSLIDTVLLVVKDCEKDLKNMFGMNSTSKFSNAVDYHTFQAKREFLSRMEFFVWEIDAIREEEKRQQDIQDTRTDATTEVIARQKSDLIKLMSEQSDKIREAKTKRDKLAGEKAWEALRIAYNSLEKTEKDMGLV